MRAMTMWKKLAAGAALAIMLGAGCGDDDNAVPVDAGRVDSAMADAAVADARVADSSVTVDAAVDAGAPMCTADHNAHLGIINAATTADSVTHNPTLALLPASGVLPPPQ